VRQGTIVQYLADYCWVELDPPEPQRRAPGPPQEVLARFRGRLELVMQQEERHLREQREVERIVAQQVAVGDRVALSEPKPGDFAVEEILPRETWLLRSSVGRYRHKPQCVVANADQLAVVVAPVPGFSLGTVDRCFLAAIQGGLEPILIVNKLDLDPRLPERLETKTYAEMGYRVFFTSALLDQGLAALGPALADKYTAFCGHSGVGKSSLLRRLTGVDIAVRSVHAPTGRGRHGTSSARLYHLPSGGEVVDTPGIREFGLAHLTWLDVHEYFSDIAALTSGCSFRDCSHTVEPDCAVRRATEEGRLALKRLESYVKLRAECSS